MFYHYNKVGIAFSVLNIRSAIDGKVMTMNEADKCSNIAQTFGIDKNVVQSARNDVTYPVLTHIHMLSVEHQSSAHHWPTTIRVNVSVIRLRVCPATIVNVTKTNVLSAIDYPSRCKCLGSGVTNIADWLLMVLIVLLLCGRHGART